MVLFSCSTGYCFWRSTSKKQSQDSLRSCEKADRSLSVSRVCSALNEALCSTALRTGIALSPASLHQLCVRGWPGKAVPPRGKLRLMGYRQKSRLIRSGWCRPRLRGSVPRCLYFECYYPYPPVDFPRLRTLLKPAAHWRDERGAHIWRRAGPPCPSSSTGQYTSRGSS